jgi:hypothetical protein
MSQYCNPKYNYPVPCREVPVPVHDNGGYPTEWGEVGNWWAPDIDALVARFREVVSERDVSFCRGLDAAKWVRGEWTVARTAQILLDIVTADAEADGIV